MQVVASEQVAQPSGQVVQESAPAAANSFVAQLVQPAFPPKEKVFTKHSVQALVANP